MWARTWKSFEIASGHVEVCSFHCLADMIRKTGEPPRAVKTALYLEPERLLPIEACFFVIDSRAPGTMTSASKLAFASESAARQFARTCGGRVAAFPVALAEARKSLPGEKQIIARKRLRSGKIVEPVDNADECPVCNMYPARYPLHRCQIQTAERTIFHFCSTRCLFTFLSTPQKFGAPEAVPDLIWVSDYLSGGWISARTAYYVVGSNEWGPMGFEAFAFDRKTDALDFQGRHGGAVRTFYQVTPAVIGACAASATD
jgi:nitrous oxide reductase accessory protein NosL